MSAAKSVPIRDALVKLLWRQWQEVGSPAARGAPRPTRSLVDPEALVLASLAMVETEPRLRDVVAGWCASNSQSLSIQRVNNLSRAYPEESRKFLRDLAALITKGGKDLRWRPLAGGGDSSAAFIVRTIKQSIPVQLERPSALLLRVRAIFGLGLRPDIIVFLLCKRDPLDYVDAGEIARALGYNRTAVKRTLDLLTAAGALSATDGPDPGYSIGWTSLYERLSLDRETPPRWKYSHQTFLWVFGLIAVEQDLKTTTAFVGGLVLKRLLREHHTFLVSDSLLVSHSEWRSIPSFETLASKTKALLDKH